MMVSKEARLGLKCLVLALTLGSTPYSVVGAQSRSTCTWDTCALRVHSAFLGGRLVRGVEDEKVAGVGWFAPTLALFEERSDTAATYYRSFRSKQNSGMALSLIALGAITAGVIAAGAGEEGLGVGLTLGGLAFGALGGIRMSSGQNDLHRAVWWYNRTLPRGQ